MKGMKIYGSLMPIVITGRGIDRPTVTLKYDNHRGGQAMLLTQGSWDEVLIGLLRTLSINWTSNKISDEITEKNTNKGYNRTPQIF